MSTLQLYLTPKNKGCRRLLEMNVKLIAALIGFSFISAKAQSNDWKLREIQSQLDQANKQLSEINARERGKEAGAIKAEEERLANLPLDNDLIAMSKQNYIRLTNAGVRPAGLLMLVREFRISMAKIQEKRNLAKQK
jgi:cell division protein FtsB